MILYLALGLVALLALGVPVAAAIGLLAMALFEVFSSVPLGAIAGEMT